MEYDRAAHILLYYNCASTKYNTHRTDFRYSIMLLYMYCTIEMVDLLSLNEFITL